MKKNHWKSLLTIAGPPLLCAATWLVTPSETAAFPSVKGQDKAGKKCERIEPSGSSVSGKCESVCKDLEVFYDTRRNRWVCGGRVVRIRR
jgi:hypothetical protein